MVAADTVEVKLVAAPIPVAIAVTLIK